LDYYKSIGFDLGRSNLGEDRIEILKSNKSWIYSPEYHVKAEESRRINNSGFHSMSASDLSNAGKNGLSNRRLSNGQLVIDYLNQNGLPIDELNWNTNRNKVGLSGIKLRFVPTYKTYLNLINNDKLI
jgi:large exoprotein involved in heme utilization and adhesion